MPVHPSFYGLQRLAQDLKLPHPKCFEIPHQSFTYYIESSGLRKLIQEKLRGTRPDDQATLEIYSQQIRRMIADALLPHELTATMYELYYELSQGFSSEHHTVQAQSVIEPVLTIPDYPVAEEQLVEGIKGPAQLITVIHQSYARLFSSRMLALFLNGQFQLEDTGVVVAVQEQLFDAEAANGIAYTTAHHGEAEVVIEIIAGYGLLRYLREQPMEADIFRFMLPRLDLVLGNKEWMLAPPLGPLSGEALMKVPERLRAGSCISIEQAQQLTGWLIRLEQEYKSYYGWVPPLELYWRADVTTRILMITDLRMRQID